MDFATLPANLKLEEEKKKPKQTEMLSCDWISTILGKLGRKTQSDAECITYFVNTINF